ncbi:2-phospho-L-lactate transferase [soil metagenome]
MNVVSLSGGVGGARLLRGLSALDEVELTAVVNVADDEVIYGLAVSPDIDTVIYTLGGVEGQQGWGYANDSHTVIEMLERFPIDTWFTIGDRDFATNLFRTARLGRGWTLSQVTTAQAAVFGVEATVVPVSDDPIRTELHVPGEGWVSFQDYFVDRQHTDDVDDVRFAGAAASIPAPGVIDAIESADVVVVGPSNPPLSIWPILAVPGVAATLEKAERVVGVSPLIKGRTIKGPADKVMRSLGLSPGNAGVLEAYNGLLDELTVDESDRHDTSLTTSHTVVSVADTRIVDVDRATALAARILGL